MAGNFVNTNALAAVGASPPVINMLAGFFMGLSTTLGIDVFLQPPLNKKAAAFQYLRAIRGKKVKHEKNFRKSQIILTKVFKRVI